MLLKDKFYLLNALHKEEGQLLASISLNADSEIFQGHFPGNPITPGVAQLEIIKEILTTYYKRTIQLKSISNCKYLAILNPLETKELTVKLDIKESEEGLKVNAFFISGEKIFTKSSGIYY